MDDERAVPLELSARFEPRDRSHGVILAVPRHAEVARQTARLARQLDLFTLEPRHVLRRYDDHGAAFNKTHIYSFAIIYS